MTGDDEEKIPQTFLIVGPDLTIRIAMLSQRHERRFWGSGSCSVVAEECDLRSYFNTNPFLNKPILSILLRRGKVLLV